MAVEKISPSSLVLVETAIIAGGKGGDRHQGVAAGARHRLVVREQFPGGRGEPTERERPDDHEPDQVAGGLGRLPGATGCERMPQGLRSPQRRLRDASTHVREVVEGDRGLGQTDVVVQRFERVGRRPRLYGGGLELGIGGRSVDPAGQELDGRAEGVALRSRRLGLVDGLREQGLGLLSSARIREGRPQVREEIEASWGPLWKEDRRPAEEIAGRDVVERGESARSGGGEQLACPLREGGRTIVSRAELFAQMQRALEVPRDRLVDLGLVGVLLDHPVGEPLVQIRPKLLREASVSCLEHEGMREAPPTAGLILRLHETSTFE